MDKSTSEKIIPKGNINLEFMIEKDKITDDIKTKIKSKLLEDIEKR